MKANVGGVDRIARIVAGVAILGFGLSRGAWWGWLGLVPLATAIFGWCPAYIPFGLSSCRAKRPAA